MLDLLEWVDYLPQQGTDRNEDIPDHLLFSDAASKVRAAARRNSQDRYQDALLVEKSKRYGLPLDSQDQSDRIQSGAPHAQILRYLSTADTISNGRIRWGIPTNGKVWRLYDNRARPRASGYHPADLQEMLEQGNDFALYSFFLLFRRDSFTLRDGATSTFLETAIAEGRRYEEQVAQDLSGVDFERVFPTLVNALVRETSERLEEVRDSALIFLYRLLFLLYAEDRGLLPVNDPRYDDYGLRKRVRDYVARRMEQGDSFSGVSTNYYNHLTMLFAQIDKGDSTIGLPPCNAGLFAAESAPILETFRLPDAVVALVIYDLSHTAVGHQAGGTRRFVNYRDMSVQQLGSIYERLLEREPVLGEAGTITIRPNPYARKDSGSFYTPQELVDLIVDRTLTPLTEERLKAFEDRAEELSSDRRPKRERLAELAKLDPAMGSGHFLVTAVDFLSDYITSLVEYSAAVPECSDGEYVSPLVARVAVIREAILQRARESDWVINESQLTDQAIIRRMVLKRCIYGVDKNPLTVELAKVSLWLHSFNTGAPLSFLDHHLRCGDSLIGLSVTEGIQELQRLGGLFATGAIQAAESATAAMQRIGEISDSDISEVQKSSALFHSVEQTTTDLRGVLDFLYGVRWLEAGMKKKELATFESPLAEAMSAELDNAFALLARGPGATSTDSDNSSQTFPAIWQEATSIAKREEFLHWEAAFQGVWRSWQNHHPSGGFDAVIGNPPWDRIKLQEVEWFATRASEIALAATAAARRTAIAGLRKQGDSLASAFDTAKERADGLGQLVRASGHYPLLGGGDVNLYSLLVERATYLVKPDGMIGLLTPSGIYADKTAANFFKTVSTGGRMAGLFDFENRRAGTDLPPFFPDVDSRFKFCAFIFGGERRTFGESDCAFFLHDTQGIRNSDRCFPLAPDDFTVVNPNTGTAPIFRTRRHGEITRAIYPRHPVLVDRSGGKERKTWPVKYVRMFDMTNDSHLIRTEGQLQAEGFYPVQGNRWKRGDELYLPLYQGRMIWQFDHRANSVRINPESTHSPYLSEPVSDEQHTDPEFLPQTQYWMPSTHVEAALAERQGYTLGFRGIARPRMRGP